LERQKRRNNLRDALAEEDKSRGMLLMKATPLLLGSTFFLTACGQAINYTYPDYLMTQAQLLL